MEYAPTTRKSLKLKVDIGPQSFIIGAAICRTATGTAFAAPKDSGSPLSRGRAGETLPSDQKRTERKRSGVTHKARILNPIRARG